MGHKDHLGTQEEDIRRRQRELKKVTSTAYQGSPPVFTEGLDQVGLKARTTGEVRDTDFPILFNIDDQTLQGNFDEYTLDLSLQTAMYHRIIIGDEDEAAAAIGNIDILFVKLPKGKELQFTIEFIKDPAIVTDPTITFSPTLEGVPAGFPDDFDVWYFLISARTLQDDTTRFELLNVGTGSGGGNTFPILYPEETIGSIGGPTQNINISGSDGQFKELTLTGNVNLTFSGFPSATVLEEFWILVNQDGTGGHTLTATGSTLKNAGILNSLLDSTALSQTLFHFVTGDGGTTIHADLVDLVAGGGGGFSGNLSDLVIDVNKDWNGKSIDNLAGIDLFANAVANGIANVDVITFISNAAASRGQFGRSDFFGTLQGLAANIMAGDNFVLAVDTSAKFIMSSSLEEFRMDYKLNMLDNQIFNIGFLESASPSRPAFGFIRLANTDQFVIRNTGDSDDLIFATGLDLLGTQSWQFTVAAGLQLTISPSTIDVKANNIVQTGNITKAAGAQDIGAVGNSYTDMFAKYFRPEPAAATTKHGFTQVADDRLLISFDSGGVRSGFGIYEDGIEKFLFEVRSGDINILNIGSSDIFTGGEEYRIQMGENGQSSARIFFIEGGTDLFLNREGLATTRGVSLQSAGITRLRATSLEIACFVDVNLTQNDIFAVKNIFSSDDSPNNQIGDSVVGSKPGGFNYYVDDKIFWAGDPDTFIRFHSNGIDIISDDDVIIASGVNDNVTIASDTQMNIFVTSGSGLTLTIAGGFPEFIFQDNALVIDGSIDLFMQGGSVELLAGSGQGFIQLQDLGGNPTQPLASFGKMFGKDIAGVTEPFWIDEVGTVSSMLGGGTGGGDRIVAATGNAIAIVQASTFQVFTESVERFNINPTGTITLISSGEINMIGNVNMQNNKIFDVSTIEFEVNENITLDNTKVLITSELQQPVGNTGTEMIFNIPNTNPGPDIFNDFYKFYTGTFPNNPILTLGRREFRYTSLNALNIPGGAQFNVSTNRITLQVSGDLETAGVFLGAIGGDIVPQFVFPFVPATPHLKLGFASSTSDDSRFWKSLFVKNINFTAGLPSGQDRTRVNIHVDGRHLFLETGSLQGNRNDIRFNRTLAGGGTGAEFAKFTDDEDVFTPENLFVISVQTIINNSVVMGIDASDLITFNGLTSINEDLTFNANRTIDWNVSTFSPTATAGPGAATPATVLGFLFIKVGGGNAKIPFYGV